jgi:hypothetical protein
MELESGQKKDCAVLHSTRSAIPADTFPTLKPQLPGPRWQLVRGSAAMQRLCFQPLPLTIRDSQVSLPSPSGALLIWPTGTTSRNIISVIATANFQNGATTLTIPDLTALSGFFAPATSGTQVSWFGDIFGGTRKSSYLPSIVRRTAPCRLWRTGEVTSSPRTGGGHSRRRSIYINGLSAAV